MVWQRYPVFRVFLSFCGGILLANFFSTPFFVFGTLLLISLISSLFLAFYKKVFHVYRLRWIFGLSISIFFLSLGVYTSHLYSEKQFETHLEEAGGGRKYYLVQLEEDPLEKENSYGARARILSVSDNAKQQEARAKMMLYLAKGEAAKKLRYGDRILIFATPNVLRGPMNPYEFDYRDYLRLKAIYYQVYVDGKSWEFISSGHGWKLIKVARDIRRKMLGYIDQWDLNDDQKAVTKALLMGYRYDIEDDLLRAYSSTGAMHVLAVSGLHVGIVYLMAGYILFFFDKIRYGTALKTLILILLLWGYAMITGMSASVTRAATMFTFVAIGSGFKRYTSIYNTILGSAMLMMLLRPTFLFEVGFQLSYAAVFGIVWLQPKFYALWKPGNWIVRQVWGITTVSMAAQLLTFPMGLYYFHQFPSLFLISNLLVIPLVTALMYVGLTALLISTIWIPDFLVLIYRGVLWCMNNGVSRIEEETAFLIDGIQINRIELVLLYLIIFLLFMWMMYGKYIRLLALGCTIIFFIGGQIIEDLRLQENKEMVVYGLQKNIAIGFYQHHRNYFLADSALLLDEDALRFHVKHHWWARDAENIISKPIYGDVKSSCVVKFNDLICFNENIIWLKKQESTLIPAADYWIVDKDQDPPESVDFVPPKTIVLSGKLNYYQVREWKTWCKNKSIPLWDTGVQGAFVLKEERLFPEIFPNFSG